MSEVSSPTPADEQEEAQDVTPTSFPTIRVGILGGLTGILCCVGPTVLAIFGIISAGTAFTWANDLYDGYTWWFRLAGLLVMAGAIYWILRRRNQCTLQGAKSYRKKMVWTLLVAIVTYIVLYALTTWLGTLA